MIIPGRRSCPKIQDCISPSEANLPTTSEEFGDKTAAREELLEVILPHAPFPSPLDPLQALLPSRCDYAVGNGPRRSRGRFIVRPISVKAAAARPTSNSCLSLEIGTTAATFWAFMGGRTFHPEQVTLPPSFLALAGFAPHNAIHSTCRTPHSV